MTPDDSSVKSILDRVRNAGQEFEAAYPGDPAERRPIHVMYGGAHLFRADTVSKCGRIALDTLGAWTPDAASLTRCIGVDDERLGGRVFRRVCAKLEREPVEDFRVDFEDGYGYRTDAEEDAHAAQCAAEMARGLETGSLPPFTGIRIKPLSAALAMRAARTLTLFINTLLDRSGRLPPHFVVTLPKITGSEQVQALADLLALIEDRRSIARGTVRMELMFETPQLVVNRDGRCVIPDLIRAADGRCRGIHFGPYDFTSGLGIASAGASLAHPACDFARGVLQCATAGTGVTVCDGPTATLPLPPHRAASGRLLSGEEQRQNRSAVRRAMRLHYDNVRRALENGIYQGWDVHPAQLPTRYAAVYAYFLNSLNAASIRLRNFIEQATRATRVGNVFDDAASAQTVLNYFLRGHACGALKDEEAVSAGLTLEELRSRSFRSIVERRRAGIAAGGAE